MDKSESNDFHDSKVSFSGEMGGAFWFEGSLTLGMPNKFWMPKGAAMIQRSVLPSYLASMNLKHNET